MENYLKKIMLIVGVALLAQFLISCAALTSHIASITVKNNGYTILGANIYTLVLNNVIVEEEGIEIVKKNSIKSGNDFEYELSWVGERRAFTIKADYTTGLVGFISLTEDHEDFELVKISDLGDGDNVVITLTQKKESTNTFATLEIDVSK